MLGQIGKFLFGLCVGALSGALAASLITPKSGDQIRGDLRNCFDEIMLDYESGKQKKKNELEADLKHRWGED